MKALHDLVQVGKVRYIGASSMWAWELAHYNHVAEQVRPSAVAPAPTPALTQYTARVDAVRVDAGPVLAALPRGGARDERVLQLRGARAHPVGPAQRGAPRAPARGQHHGAERGPAEPGELPARASPPCDRVLRVLTGAQPPEWDDEIVRRVEALAKDKGWTMSQVALAWIGEKVTSPIVGVSSVRAARPGAAPALADEGAPGEAPGGGDHHGKEADAGGDQVAGGALPAGEHPRPLVEDGWLCRPTTEMLHVRIGRNNY
jgi:hypothetical protein